MFCAVLQVLLVTTKEKHTHRITHTKNMKWCPQVNVLCCAAGAAGDPVEGAVFIFKNTTKDDIEAFVQADPYVQNGLVPNYSIKPYAVVVGSP
jgi:uncharacterized protein YciI